ncbi:MAG: permease [Bacillota bacterium]|nr:permease [Bacillota bacterium]MDW7677991.1 permease [Bacillota bacterium]
MSETVIFVLSFVINASIGLAPFFLLSVSVASLIKTLRLEQYFERAFRGRQLASVPVAAGTGAFSPLCSCGVIPAIAAMLAAGIPLAPIMAFWITSPLMSPESFVLTYSILGSEMAVARLVATLVIGLIAGYLTLYLMQRGFLEPEVLKDFGANGNMTTDMQEIEQTLDKRQLILLRFFQFLINVKDMGIFIGKYILLAFVLEAFIVRYVPMVWVAGILGSGNEAGPLLAAIVGVPAYASSISAMPVVRGLMDLGMDKGTALAFMIGGAATSIPAMAAVFSIVKRKVFFLYLAYSMVGAIASGYIYRLI